MLLVDLPYTVLRVRLIWVVWFSEDISVISTIISSFLQTEVVSQPERQICWHIFHSTEASSWLSAVHLTGKLRYGNPSRLDPIGVSNESAGIRFFSSKLTSARFVAQICARCFSDRRHGGRKKSILEHGLVQMVGCHRVSCLFIFICTFFYNGMESKQNDWCWNLHVLIQCFDYHHLSGCRHNFGCNSRSL